MGGKVSSAENLSEIASYISSKIGFTLDKEIGKGGFKQTFKVITKDGSFGALKIYNSSVISERTEREISSMNRCAHDGIAKINTIDKIAFNSNEYLYLIEEYIGGGTLTNRLAQGIMNSTELICFGNQMIDIIEYISGLGLVHRDIKPDNILFRDEGTRVVITDFGIVRGLSEISLTPTFLPSAPGTHGYAAPEQENNMKPHENWRTDQFSCGIVLSLCGLGIHPFGSSQLEAYKAISSFGDTTSVFKESIISSDYSAIQKMVEVWPVNRFRLIKDLRLAWNS